MVSALAEAWDVDVKGPRAPHLPASGLGAGFRARRLLLRPRLAAIRGRTEIAPRTDPSPDVVVEIDISRSSIRELGIFEQFGVPEVWRHDGERASILVLEDGEYREAETSAAFPLLAAQDMTRLRAVGGETPLPRWLADTRAWATEAAQG